jgi:branched-chain amino acid transport system permease protein
MITYLNILIDSPEFLAQLVINGLLVGAIFALIAYGLALIWGVMDIINFAQGEMVIFGGYLTYTLFYQFGIHPILSIPIVAVLLFVFGLLVYKTVIIRLLGEKDIFITILATFGLAILMQQLMQAIFGPDVVTANPELGMIHIFDGKVSISNIQLISFFIAAAVAIALFIIMKYSRMGQAIRATAQNPRASRILGIDIEKVYANTFAINAALCGIGGSLVVMVWTIHPFIGLVYTFRSFMIVILAGLGNFVGIIFAGMGISSLENVTGFVIGAEFQAAVIFCLLVIILVTRSIMARKKRQYIQ